MISSRKGGIVKIYDIWQLEARIYLGMEYSYHSRVGIAGSIIVYNIGTTFYKE